MTTFRLKNLIISNGLKDHKCECCGLTEWNNKPIPIELHHIDGDRNNNSIDNLQIICPNCHAQTENYKSKNRKSYIHGKNILDADIIRTISESKSISEVLRKFSIPRSLYFRERCKAFLQSGEAKLKPNKTPFRKKITNSKKRLKKTHHCSKCGCVKSKGGTTCQKCHFADRQSKIKPEKLTLISDIHDLGYSKTGQKYGVSDNAVRKWIRSFGLSPNDVRFKKYNRKDS